MDALPELVTFDCTSHTLRVVPQLSPRGTVLASAGHGANTLWALVILSGGGVEMARDARGRDSRSSSGGKKDWTHKLDSAKVYIYILEIVVFVLLIVRNILRDIDELKDNQFNLLEVLVPISIMVVLIGAEEVLISTIVSAFRKDLSERYRYLESAKRSALSTAIAGFVIAVIVLAPPIQEMIEDAAGTDTTVTRAEYYDTFSSKDSLNLTGITRVYITNLDGVLFDLVFSRVDSGRTVDAVTNVTGWERNLGLEDVDRFLIDADLVNHTGDVTWKVVMETKLRPEMVSGIAVPFLFLGIINAVWYPLARLWSGRTEASYVDTQTRKLRARFKIEEAFLIYEDGRLIAHNSRRLKPERDKDIMTGMLTAVQSFVTDTLIDEERGTLDQLKYGNLSILVEGKGSVNLATIISGDESPVLRQGMKNIVSYINGQYRRYLDDWDGDIDRFRDVKRYIGHLVSTGKEEPVYPDELFLLHRDGRLIAHQTSRLEPSIDDSMLQNWVDQLVGQLNRVMADPSKSMPPVVNIMGYDVWLEYTNYLHMAMMSTRKDEDRRREMMSDVLTDVDGRFHDVLYDWDGATHELTDVKVMMEVILNP
jgi:hypothetical protein